MSTPNTLIASVNRWRSQGWKYHQIRDKLVNMGNSPEAAQSAISEYVNEMCGVDSAPAWTDEHDKIVEEYQKRKKAGEVKGIVIVPRGES